MTTLYQTQEIPPLMVHWSRRIRSIRRLRPITRSAPRARNRSRRASSRDEAEEGLAVAARVRRWAMRMSIAAAKSVPSLSPVGSCRFVDGFTVSVASMAGNRCSGRHHFCSSADCPALEPAARTPRWPASSLQRQSTAVIGRASPLPRHPGSATGNLLVGSSRVMPRCPARVPHKKSPRSQPAAVPGRSISARQPT